MNLANVMRQLGTQLDTISELNVFSYEEKAVTAPAAMVLWPLDMTYDATFGRGSDQMTIQVVVVVGTVSAESSRDALAAYCDGSGARSIKAVLESTGAAYTEFAPSEIRVTGVDFGTWDIAGTPYLAALFDIDINGDGA